MVGAAGLAWHEGVEGEGAAWGFAGDILHVWGGRRGWRVRPNTRVWFDSLVPDWRVPSPDKLRGGG